MRFNQDGVTNEQFVAMVRDFLRDRRSWISPGGARNLRNQITEETRGISKLDDWSVARRDARQRAAAEAATQDVAQAVAQVEEQAEEQEGVAN